MGYRENYEEWLNNPYFDEATKEELKSIEMAIVPHSYTKGDLNHVKIDFEGFENYYITIKMLA